MLKKLTEEQVRELVMQYRGSREEISDEVFLAALAFYDEFLARSDKFEHDDRLFAAFFCGYISGAKGGM